jgi:hypothetical protein
MTKGFTALDQLGSKLADRTSSNSDSEDVNMHTHDSSFLPPPSQ